MNWFWKSVYGTRGDEVRLGRRLGAGGEGRVYEAEAGRCAKIFHLENQTPERRWKLETMLRNPVRDRLLETHGLPSLAWPQDILYAQGGEKWFRGYVMPRADRNRYHAVAAVLTPSDQTRVFGRAWSPQARLVVAHNIASIVAGLHDGGYRVGDLNDENVLVAADGTVFFLDCDSYQIPTADGRFHPCRVARAEYAPPELQGVDLQAMPVDRLDADRFALGVLVFRILMDGFHPYQAVGTEVEGLGSTALKIRAGKFAYGAPASSRLAPPPRAPAFDRLSSGVASLFDRLFTAGHANPGTRHTAREWRRCLAEAVSRPEGLAAAIVRERARRRSASP